MNLNTKKLAFLTALAAGSLPLIFAAQIALAQPSRAGSGNGRQITTTVSRPVSHVLQDEGSLYLVQHDWVVRVRKSDMRVVGKAELPKEVIRHPNSGGGGGFSGGGFSGGGGSSAPTPPSAAGGNGR